MNAKIINTSLVSFSLNLLDVWNLEYIYAEA
jgi:hypothetical protein